MPGTNANRRRRSVDRASLLRGSVCISSADRRCDSHYVDSARTGRRVVDRKVGFSAGDGRRQAFAWSAAFDLDLRDAFVRCEWPWFRTVGPFNQCVAGSGIFRSRDDVSFGQRFEHVVALAKWFPPAPVSRLATGLAKTGIHLVATPGRLISSQRQPPRRLKWGFQYRRKKG